MRARLAVLWLNVWESFWFIPALMTLVSLVLAVLVVNLDERLNVAALPGLGWVYGGSADGARSMLAAIAASTLGVAGTAFSITIAALALASGQMGPRLLDQFTRDHGNQVALGTFVATFAYALMVLRTIRSSQEGLFVPHLAVTLGLGLALLSLGVLIYFIHHIAGAIKVGHVIRSVADDLERVIEKQFAPEGRREQTAPHRTEETPHVLRATTQGYVQAIDLNGLVRVARKREGVIHLRVRPGNFVFSGMPVAHLSSPLFRDMPGEIVIGARRTAWQDVEFAAWQLVEIAVRSLSPAINDPFSAITCLDYLGAALCRVSGRSFPPSEHFSGGALRLTVPVTDYDGLTDVMFHQIRQNGGDHPAVMVRMLEVLTRVSECEGLEQRQRTLQRHAELIMQIQEQGTWVEADRQDLQERYRRFHQVAWGQGTAAPTG